MVLRVRPGAAHPGPRPGHSRAMGRAGGRRPHLGPPRCQLSLGQLSLRQSMVDQPRPSHPRLGHPDLGHPTLDRLDRGCLGSGCLGSGCLGSGRLGPGCLGPGCLGPDHLSRARPSQHRPSQHRPSRARPNQARPSRSLLSSGRPALAAGAAPTWTSRMRRPAGCPWQASRVSTATWPGRAMLGGPAGRCHPVRPQRHQDRAISPGHRPARALRAVPDGPPSFRLELPIRPRNPRQHPASFAAARACRTRARQAARASRERARRPDRPWPGRLRQRPPRTPLAAPWVRAEPAVQERPRHGTATPLIPRRPARSRRKRPVSPPRSACRACTGVYGAAGRVAACRAGG